jgi:hypothetical protein
MLMMALNMFTVHSFAAKSTGNDTAIAFKSKMVVQVARQQCHVAKVGWTNHITKHTFVILVLFQIGRESALPTTFVKTGVWCMIFIRGFLGRATHFELHNQVLRAANKKRGLQHLTTTSRTTIGMQLPELNTFLAKFVALVARKCWFLHHFMANVAAKILVWLLNEKARVIAHCWSED